MIVLDTNVVSEPMKLAPNRIIQAWLDRQVADTLYLTATSLSELLVGIAVLPAGRRGQGWDVALVQLISTIFGGRILPFDRIAAEFYAAVFARARAAGQAIAVADGQVATIAASHGFIVATRDTKPFVAAGVTVINPWEAVP